MSSEAPSESEQLTGMGTQSIQQGNMNAGDAYSNNTEYPRGRYFIPYDVTTRLVNDGVRTDSYSYAKRSEAQLFEDISSLIGDCLSAKGLNLQDPVKTNMFFYNKTGKEMALDPPQYGKTYVFFTRPDLNLCKANIDSNPTFKWFFSTQLGKEVMSMLTGPDRPIYGNITGYSKEELNEEKIDLMEANPISFLSNTYDIAKKPINGLYDLFKRNFGEQVQGMYEQIQQKVDAAIDKGKEGLSILRNLQNDVIQWINNRTRVPGGQGNNPSGIFDEMAYRIYEGKPEDEEPLIENRDPEVWNPQSDDDFEFIAKRIPQFYNTQTGKYGNTKRIPMTKSDETLLYNSPWIVMLTNNCKSIPAGKDVMLESFEYAEDFRNHKMNVALNGDSFNSSGEFTANFKDNIYNAVWWLFKIWVDYIASVSIGEMIPRWGHIVNRIIDYTCSVYIFCLDRDGQTIKYWAKYTGCSPRSYPLNMIYHQDGQLDNEALSNISITFTYNYMEVMNPEIFTDFNFLSETEWRRNLNLDHSYFSIENTEEVFSKDLDPAQIWKYMDHRTEAGLSGKVPIKSLPGRFDTRHLDHYKSWLERESNMFEYDYTDHYGGYPYIINGGRHFVWINPNLALRRVDEQDVQDMNNKGIKPEYNPKVAKSGYEIENETQLIIG